MITFDAETAGILENAYIGADITRRRRLSFDALDPKPGETILDIGCGNGLLTAELARAVGPAGQVIGIDPSPDMLTLARARCDGYAWVELAEGRADALPRADSSADKAVSVQVFEYLDDIPAAAREIHRVLRPGGTLVVSDIHFDSLVWHSDDPARMNRMIAAWDEHFVERRVPAILPPILRQEGFDVSGVTTSTFTDCDLRPDGIAIMMLRLMEGFAIQKGLVPEADARAWRAEQEDLARRGGFFFSISHYAVSACKS